MSPEIRIRACLAVVEQGKILLVPHYQTDDGEVQWLIPGGEVHFGESLEHAAEREFTEETGLQAEVSGLLNASQVILPERHYHSITIAYTGTITGGALRPEAGHPYGEKAPRWFSAEEVHAVPHHPKQAIAKALGK